MANNTTPISPDNILGLVAQLPSMESDEIKKIWSAYFEDAPLSYRRSYMVPRLAYRIQEVTYGGLSNKALERLEELIKDGVKGNKTIKPIVGTKLLRVYKNVEHQVTVTRNGYEYLGATHNSLSVIANLITGSHMSGPKFFGLKD